MDEEQVELVAALCRGDERVFSRLVALHTPTMLRVARDFVPNREAAEDVVQETWIALLKGISAFEGRSSLRTWLFAVLVNIAKARGVKDRRRAEVALTRYGEATVDPGRFLPADDPEWPGHWRDDAQPVLPPDTPEGSLLAEELTALAQRTIDTLPQRQRMVITLRDMLTLESSEVCELLDISVGNQRVLLHRARAQVREALEDYMRDDE